MFYVTVYSVSTYQFTFIDVFFIFPFMGYLYNTQLSYTTLHSNQIETNVAYW